MKKFTLLIASLFFAIGAMAQTPVLELTSEQIGTYPYKLSDEDAAKVFALGDITIEFDVTLPSSLDGRKALLVASDPAQPALASDASGVKTNSPYYGFGINDSDAGYFASSKDGDRFTAGSKENALTSNNRCIMTYVVDNTNKVITVIADGKIMYSCVYPVIEYEMPNFVNIKSRYSGANIYIGGGVTYTGNIDTFNGTINSVKVYEGARANTYFRFKATDTNNSSLYYLVADDTKITTNQAGSGTESIFYYNNNTLLSYYAGKSITYGNHTNIGATPSKAIIHSSNSKNPYKIWVAGKYIEANQSQSNGIGFYTRNFNANLPSTTGSNWTIEKVEALPVTITDAQYATFYAPVEVTVPEGVEAYYVTADGVNSTYITLTKIEDGVVPANTGVILYAEEGAYDLEITSTGAAAITGNLLRGTAAATYVTDDAYVLAKNANNEAYLGKATKNQSNNSAWKNNSHKAYLPASAVPAAAQASNGFRFGEGTTGIDEITDNRVQSTVIYDLTGRRVENISAPGIYIVGGKKVLVK